MPAAQLERGGEKNSLEYRIVNEFMEALGKRRIPEIARGTGESVDDVQKPWSGSPARATSRAGLSAR